MTQTGSVVPEIWRVKIKSRGRIYSSRRVYLAKYGIAELSECLQTCLEVIHHHCLEYQDRSMLELPGYIDFD